MGNTTSQCPGAPEFSPVEISTEYVLGTDMPLLDRDDPSLQWPYCPSLPAAATITACFAALTIAHLSQALLYRKRFCWVICMATFWETAGFTMRLLGARDPRTQAYSIGSNLLVLLSPLWVNAFAYMVVGRMIYYWLPSKSIWRLKARTMTAWFVWIDVVLFFVQATGGSMLENEDPASAKMGLYIYMAGIGVQQGILLLFLLIMIKFNINVHQQGLDRPTSWRRLLYSLYIVLALISIRITFRLVEFSSGINGPIPKNEAFFYTLEATPMVLAIGIFAVIHPGRTLTGPESEFSPLDEAGS
ncbi:RTA1 like protein-domain-containing protein [Plectosphaerella plurivora]|uniref:RTA1 like protein-domain-containing protein n=1 Tax=Plectosphaerella plurivora TaxID=936078 RepID=A0A9P8VBT6_9PEZI|nr:RTA1 like protein-domain-containing protein [Plectosphaerella plurivora]